MKVYVLIKCEMIEVMEESYCDCCGADINTYNGDPEVLGVYSNLNKFKNKLKQLNFNKEEIEYMIKNKWNSYKNYYYYLEEKELD